ncbi:MAG: 3'-5' exonuclease [Stutzerimonas stutzeri]|nr:MAG: 3'-5' exonuclease [Stutzerimonas stutzeri]
MLIAGIDIETTGFLAADHRIIEVFIGLWRPDNPVPAFVYEQRIDPQRSISADAQRVHKISGSDLIGKPTWDAVAPAIVKILGRADANVWHNGDEFDGPFIKQELERVGLKMPERPSLDTMVEGVWATPDGKKPKLQELCFASGVDYDPAAAHAASYDVLKMMECYFFGLKTGFFRGFYPEGMSLAA